MANKTQMLSAGVYLTEIDNSSYTSATTSNLTGIVGKAKKGDTGIIYLTEKAQVEKLLGTPDEDSYGIHAALLVLKAGGPVAFKRIIHEGAKATCGTKEDPFIISALENGEVGNEIKVVVTEPSGSNFDLEVLVNDVQVEYYASVVLDSGHPNSVDSVVNSQSAFIRLVVNSGKAVTAKEYQLAGGTSEVAKATGGNKESDALVAESKTYDSTINGANIVISARDYLGLRHYRLVQGSTELERISNLVDNKEDSRFLASFITKHSEYINMTYIEKNKTQLDSGEEITIKLTGGKDGCANIDNYDVTTALQDFTDSEAIKIRTLIAPGYTDYQVIQSGIEVAESRQDCLFLFDGKEEFTPQQILNWSNGVGVTHEAFSSDFGVLYYPWLLMYDNYTKKEIYQPACSYMAAQYVINDTLGDVYTAPAGIERGNIPGAIGLKHDCNKITRDLLYGNRNVVNPISKFVNHGILVWGQKTTLRTPSVFDRVNNRRLANFLMSTILESTMSLVFEGNHTVTWDKWVARVEPILDRMKSSNGIVDYRISMGEESISTNEVENHIMPGVISIQYNNTAEYIPLDFVAYNTSHTFEDED